MRRLGRPRLAAIVPPLAAWLIGGLVAGFFANQVVGWYVMSDELQYVKLAVSIGDGMSLTPHLRGEEFGMYSQLYSIFTAPFYALMSMPDAFEAVHIFNAVVMASAAVPVYILARELELPKVAATAVALVSVLTPWMALTTVVMTEALAYPVFLWAILAMQRASARPSPGRDLVAVGAILLAFFARTQFLILAVVYLAVVVLQELRFAAAAETGRLAAVRRLPRAMLRGHPFMLLAVLGAALLPPMVGKSYRRQLLGNYSEAAGGNEFGLDLLESVVQHVDRVAVGVGVIPLLVAIGWALATVWRPASREHHAFSLILLITFPLLALQVAWFVLRLATANAVYDRYLFYVVPLFFLGLAVFLYSRVRRELFVAIGAVGLAFVVMVHNMDYNPGAQFFVDSPPAFFHSVLDGQAWRLGTLFGIGDLSPTPLIQLLALATAVGLPLALLRLPRTPVIAVVGGAVFAFSAIQCVYVFAKHIDAGTGSNRIGVIGKEPVMGTDWVDARVPDDATVGVVPFPAGAYPEAIWWNVEFWNKTVTRAYSYGETSAYYTPFPEHELWRERGTQALITDVSPLAPYLVMERRDLRFRPVGHVIEHTSELELIELERPYTAAWTSRNLGFEGVLWKGEGSLRLYGGPGRGSVLRRVTLSLAASPQIDPAQPRAPQLRRQFDIRGPGLHKRGVLRPGEQRTVSVNLCIRTGASEKIRLRGNGAGWYGAAPGIPGLPIGVKVPAVEVVTAARSCA